MHPATLVTLNVRELDRLKVIQAVVDMGLKPGRAAERLGLSVRQVERLVIRYCESGAAGLVSRKRGRQGNRRLEEDLAQRALAIIRERYADFGPTLACEKLYECHGIRLAKETVRRLMTDVGLWIPRRQRPPKIYQPRARRSCLGELVQIDGSDHRWFEERAPACTLLGVCGRCNQPADGAAFHGDRVDLQLFRGDACISAAVRQAGGVL
jgi:transposase